MLNVGKFSCLLRKSLWTEVGNNNTVLETKETMKSRELNPFQHFWEEKEKCKNVMKCVL